MYYPGQNPVEEVFIISMQIYFVRAAPDAGGQAGTASSVGSAPLTLQHSNTILQPYNLLTLQYNLSILETGPGKPTHQ